MNKSELIILKQLKEIDELKEYNMKLKDKVEGLQDRINSTINYIEKYKTEDYCDGMSANQLLDILKGDNK